MYVCACACVIALFCVTKRCSAGPGRLRILNFALCALSLLYQRLKMTAIDLHEDEVGDVLSLVSPGKPALEGITLTQLADFIAPEEVVAGGHRVALDCFVSRAGNQYICAFLALIRRPGGSAVCDADKEHERESRGSFLSPPT